MGMEIWRVVLDDRVYTIELKHGFWSGRRRIKVNGNLVHLGTGGVKVWLAGSRDVIRIGEHTCEVLVVLNFRTNRYGYALLVDGEPAGGDADVLARVMSPPEPHPGTGKRRSASVRSGTDWRKVIGNWAIGFVAWVYIGTFAVRQSQELRSTLLFELAAKLVLACIGADIVRRAVPDLLQSQTWKRALILAGGLALLAFGLLIVWPDIVDLRLVPIRVTGVVTRRYTSGNRSVNVNWEVRTDKGNIVKFHTNGGPSYGRVGDRIEAEIAPHSRVAAVRPAPPQGKPNE